jgi:hypothetical protein
MGLTRKTSVNDIFFFGDEMDPVFEDRLALALDEYAKEIDNKNQIGFHAGEEVKGNVLVVDLEPSTV